MALTLSFLNTCRDAALLLAEYDAFALARDSFGSADEDDRQARWVDAYSDAQAGASPAYRFRKAIRDVISLNATADHSLADRESAYQQIVADLAPEVPMPTPTPEARGAFLTAEDLDLIRLAVSRVAND